jgi:hypothetical protein
MLRLSKVSEQPVWCAKCYLRVAPYDLRTVYRKTTYHQHCFLKLIREKAHREGERRAGSILARKEARQHA